MDTLKQRMAETLFELSMESEAPEEYLKQANFVRDVLQTNQIEDFLNHPHISDSDKEELLQKLFENKISRDLMAFLCLAISKSREALIVSALSSYIDIANHHSGKVVANVVSATELRDEQVSALNAVLSKKLDKQVEVVTNVDSALIGGFYVYVDGRLIDLTVRTQLSNMKENIERGDVE